MKKRKKLLERILSLVIVLAMTAGLIFSPTGVASASGTQETAGAPAEVAVETADTADEQQLTETKPENPEVNPAAEENAGPTSTQEPTPGAEPTDMPELTQAVEPTDMPEPTPDAEPTDMPEPTQAVEPTTTPEPVRPVEYTGELKVFNSEGELVPDNKGYEIISENGWITLKTALSDELNGQLVQAYGEGYLLDDLSVETEVEAMIGSQEIESHIEKTEDSRVYKLRIKADASENLQNFQITLSGRISENGKSGTVTAVKKIQLHVVEKKDFSFEKEGAGDWNFENSVLTLSYGDQSSVLAVLSGEDNRKITLDGNTNADVAEVKCTGNVIQVTAKDIGETVVTVTAKAGQTKYETTSKSFTIKVNPRKIEIGSETEIEAKSREYRPGQYGVQAEIAVTDGIPAGDTVAVQVNGTLRENGAGQHEWKAGSADTQLYAVSGNADVGYKYELVVEKDAIFNGTADIVNAKVYPAVTWNWEADWDPEVTWGPENSEIPNIPYGDFSRLWEKCKISYYYQNEKTVADELNNGEKEELFKVENELFPSGDAQKIVSVDYNAYKEDTFENYEVVSNPEHTDSVSAVITEMLNPQEKVNFKFEPDVADVSEAGGQVPIVGRNSAFTIEKVQANELFDGVRYRWNSNETWETYRFDGNVPEIKVGENAEKILRVQLTKNEQPVSGEFEVNYKADLTAPTGKVSVTAQSGSEDKIEISSQKNPGESETFPVYKYADNEAIAVGISEVADLVPENSEQDEMEVEQAASGVNDVAYKIVAVNENTDLETLNQEAIDADGYTEIEPDENGEYSFMVEADSDGVYIFLIRLSDKLGNSVVYTSDGAVLDTQEPVMHDIVLDGQGNGTVYENSNLQIRLGAEERRSDGTVTAGIQKIESRITVNGVCIDGGDIEIAGQDNAEIKTREDQNDCILVFESENPIGDAAPFEQAFSLKELNDGDDVRIEAWAVDYAGNVSGRTERAFEIDNAAPSIGKIELEHGNSMGPDRFGGTEMIPYIGEKDGESGAEVSFNITERNLKKVSVTVETQKGSEGEEAAQHTFEIDVLSGMDGQMDLVDNEGQKMGILSVSREECDAGWDWNFCMKFTEENHYRITSVKAGDLLEEYVQDELQERHTAQAASDLRFVYDRTAPVLEQAYYQYNSGEVQNLDLAGSSSILYVGKNGENPNLVFKIAEANVWEGQQAQELVSGVLSGVKDLNGNASDSRPDIAYSVENGVMTVSLELSPGRYEIQLKAKDYAGNLLGWRNQEDQSFQSYGEEGYQYILEANNRQPEVDKVIYHGSKTEGANGINYFSKGALTVETEWKQDYLTGASIEFTVQNYKKDTTEEPLRYCASWEGISTDGEVNKEWTIKNCESDSDVTDDGFIEVKWTSDTDLGGYGRYHAVITIEDPGAENDREVTITRIYAEDKYGMNGSKDENFCTSISDNTEPEVAVTHNYIRTEDEAALPDAYYNPGATEVTVSIHERYLDMDENGYLAKDKLKLSVGRVENPQISDSEKDYEIKEASHKWDRDTHTYQVVFTVPEDGKYHVEAGYTDYVGYTGNHQDEFVVDTVHPEGKITISGDRTAEGYEERTWQKSWAGRLIDKITFGLFSREDTSVTLEASDLTAGVRYIEYLKDVYEIDLKEDGTAVVRGSVDKDGDGRVTAQDIENAVTQSGGKLDWTRFESTSVAFSVNPGEQYVIYEKITDNAGNIWYVSSDGVIVDNEAPSNPDGTQGPQITINTQAAKNIYNKDVELSVSVEDPVKGTYSGIERVWYVVRAEGNVSKISDEVTITPVSEQENSLQGNRTWSYTFPVFAQGGLDISEYNSNDVTVIVYAQDYSGNISSEFVNFSVDVTKPQAEVKYDSPAMPQHEFYYSQPRTATFTFTERNLDYRDITDLTFYIQREKDKQAGEYGIAADGSRLYLANAAGVELEGISVSVEDTQSDRLLDPKQLSDDRKTTVRLTFNKDDAYTVSARIIDRAYNEPAFTTEEHFVVDNTDPMMRVSYFAVDENGNNAEDITNGVKTGRVYKNQTIRCEITIDEHNFMLGDAVEGIDVQVKTARNTENISDYHKLAETSSWESNGDIRKLSYTFTLDGEYVQNMTYTDLSGRTVSDREAKFNVDKTQPNGQIKVVGHDGWSWSSLLSAVTFGLFDQNGVTVAVNADDYTSPLKTIEYARFPQMKTLQELENYNAWADDGNSAAEFEKAVSYGIGTNEQFIVYAKLTDYAGNVRYISSNGIVLDNTQPAPEITITNLSQASNDIFNEDVVLQIDVEDPIAGDTYSGLEKIWYSVSAVGNVNVSDTITLMDNSSNRVQSHRIWSGTVTIPANIYNSNDVTVTAYARDFAGNESHTEQKLKIDSTNPKISVAYDRNDPMNGQYYKDTRTAVVTITDRNFDPNNVHFIITNTDGTPAAVSGWSSSADSGVSDSATHTATVSFAADGDYSFTLNCTDLAGNSVEYGQTDTFTVDKTIPEISVSYDNNSAVTSGYYKEQRTATISVREHNFNAADVRADITAQLEGQGFSAPSVSGFTTSGDVHTATVTYAADGDYTFDISYTDLAGNAAVEYIPEQFTIDLTAPEVEIIDIQDKSANNGVVAPGFTYSDINYDTDNVTVTLTGANHGTVTVGSAAEEIANGQKIKLNDFAYTEEMDDLYTLKVKVGDKAGNETEKSVMFSVNRFGSVYVLDEETKQWLSTDDDDYTYINKEKAVGIIEYNVDDIEVSRITSDRDGNLNNLISGSDYTVEKSGNDAQWKEYYYQIEADNFEEEGNYTLTLYSEDRASNTTNNTSMKHKGKELPLSFTVDKTAPTVVISGVENEGQYRSAERTMTIDAKDNLMLAEVTVDADGTRTTYDARTLAENDGVISVDLEQSNRWQTIKVTAKDAAGNSLGSDEDKEENGVVFTSDGLLVTVLITPNIVVQYYMNKPLFFGSIIAVLVVVAVVVAVMLRKRKQKEIKR